MILGFIIGLVVSGIVEYKYSIVNDFKNKKNGQ